MSTSSSRTFSDKERQNLLKGVELLHDAVKVTIPKGRGVEQPRAFGAPTITRDGVSIAKEVELAEPSRFGKDLRDIAARTQDVSSSHSNTASRMVREALVKEASKAASSKTR
ncbi:molecular chaperone GroEL [Cladorrhinum sp. PSN259]|nr:molecular chaperone GroEL [Cladorrhinum sp. PSN259]